MRVLDKIDDFLDNLDEKEKKQKNILGNELAFLYKTEEDESLKELIGVIQEKAKVGGKDYDDYFKSVLKKYNVSSSKDLKGSDKKKFFDEVDKGWNTKVEKGGDGLKKYKKGESSM